MRGIELIHKFNDGVQAIMFKLLKTFYLKAKIYKINSYKTLNL